MSKEVLFVKDWLEELKRLEILKNKLIEASEKINRTNIPYFSGFWVLNHILGYSDKELENLIKKKS